MLLAIAALVPARPASTAANPVQPRALSLESSAQLGGNQTELKQTLERAATCGLDATYSAKDRFGVERCDEIKVSELPEGRSCEDYYTRQTLFTICRSRDTSNPLSCDRGANFTCWVPGISNLASAKKAGIRLSDEQSDGCEDCLEIGPWLVPPGYAAYPNGPPPAAASRTCRPLVW